MIHKSPTQPYCRMCGKAIAKYVRRVTFRSPKSHERYGGKLEDNDWWKTVVGEARTREDLRQFTNLQIVSIQRDHVNPEQIGGFGEWDGESER